MGRVRDRQRHACAHLARSNGPRFRAETTLDADRAPRRGRGGSQAKARGRRRRVPQRDDRLRRLPHRRLLRPGRQRADAASTLRPAFRRFEVLMRAEALESYRALPLPDTTEEHWRFTDLKDFDPDSSGRGQTPAVRDTSAGMLELDVAGIATITESGVQIERAPEGVTFEPLTEEHERLYSLVGWDEKFAAHNAAVWKHGLLVVVPKGIELERPLYVRVTNSSEDGSLFWRLLVVAEEDGRSTPVEEVAAPA